MPTPPATRAQFRIIFAHKKGNSRRKRAGDGRVSEKEINRMDRMDRIKARRKDEG
jgi:hypothetical protein